MEVKVILEKELEKELLISVPWEMIRVDYDDLLKRYSKLQVKGFRSGKSPISLIESHFAQHIKNDLLAIASTRLCRKALKEKNMISGTPIELSDTLLQKNEYLEFKASFIEMPVFDLPDYANLNLQSDNKNDMLDEISSKLLDSTNIALHHCFIDNELGYTDGDVNDELEKSNAEARVKLMLILKKIALINQIEVDEKDVENRIKVVATENDVTPEELKKFLIENKGFSRFADSLLAEMVFDYIIEIQN